MYMHTNPNPRNHEIDDCVVRAIAIATGHSWDYVQLSLCIYSFDLKGMSSTNFVWDSYLRDIGYKRYNPPYADIPHRFTVKDFCNMYKYVDASYILATGTHVVAVVNGDYYDTWDSGDEEVRYIYAKEDDI